eukprot:gene13591-18241_t
MTRLFELLIYIAYIALIPSYFNLNLIEALTRCNIVKESLDSLLFSDLPDYPVIYVYNITHNQRNAQLSMKASKDMLLSLYADEIVKLSSSNTFSHGLKQMTLANYIHDIIDNNSDQYQSSVANETFYFFGNNYHGIWKELAVLYEIPPCQYCHIDGVAAVTIGIGGNNSGVSFHFHGPGFSEVIFGEKRWFLFPPNLTQIINKFNPNQTMARWVDEWYNNIINRNNYFDYDNTSIISRDGNSLLYTNDDIKYEDGFIKENIPNNIIRNELIQILRETLYECTIKPNEILYFPAMWMHATLNTDSYNFFVSSFLDTQLMRDRIDDI